jgi:cyclophilin family peptidyl-prolyl cis-trans isomerase
MEHEMFKTLKIALTLWIALTAQGLMAQTHPQVDFDTTAGKFRLELREDLAPETVKNFLTYVKDGFYTNTIFHRVIGDFMIQGGGMTAEFEKKETRDPIKNEASNGLKNLPGTVAMARTGQPHSATSQFFINVKDNEFLNHRAPSGQSWGYAVFGKIVSGMDVIEKIKQAVTTTRNGHQNVPVETILIKSATLVPVEN